MHNPRAIGAAAGGNIGLGGAWQPEPGGPLAEGWKQTGDRKDELSTADGRTARSSYRRTTLA